MHLMPNEARRLYVAVEIFLHYLDNLQAPDYLTGDKRDAWQRAIIQIRCSCAESQLRSMSADMLRVLQDEPDALRRVREAWATAQAVTSA
jgi:hypothetical protein